MPQTLNRYVYCINNPLRYVDPTGMDPAFKEWDAFWGGVGNWWNENWQTIAQALILIGTIALTIVTAGISSPLLAIAVGAAIGAASSGISTYIATGDIGASIQSAIFGGIMGGIGGGVGASLNKYFATKATFGAAQTLRDVKYPSCNLKFINWNSKISRGFSKEAGNAFGYAGKWGTYATDSCLFRAWGSVDDLERMTGTLLSRDVPTAAGLFRSSRGLWAIERISADGGGRLPSGFEYIVPFSTGSKYLKQIGELPIFGS